jgi:hypothetical protein
MAVKFQIVNGTGDHRQRPVTALFRQFLRHPKSAVALWRDRQTDFKYELAIGAIFKDEALYLDEWLTFHHGVGVGHFYLYNNNSSDGYRRVLSPWIDAGLVTLIDWPRQPGQIQVPAYEDCLRRCRKEARWIAFIDIDEFLFSPQTRDLGPVLQRYANLPGIFIYWQVFGSSGHAERPAGPVIEAYTRRLDEETANKEHTRPGGITGKGKQGKSIVNPRLVRQAGAHRPMKVWVGDILDENRLPPPFRDRKGARISYEILRINHYWSKSTEDLRKKVERNRAFNDFPEKLERSLEREKMLNAVEDRTILRLWTEIKDDPSR